MDTAFAEDDNHITRSDIANSHKLICKLWLTKPDQFNQAWQHALELLEALKTIPTQYLVPALVQLRMIHQFMLHLYIDRASQSLAYVSDTASSSTVLDNLQPMVEMLQKSPNNQYTRFCLLYGELLSRAFMDALCRTFNDPENKGGALARDYYYDLCQLRYLLRDSREQGRFSQQLMRYNELLNMLTALQSKAFSSE